MADRALDDLVVVELAGSLAGANAAKLFGDHGAHVVRIETPTDETWHLDEAAWAVWGTSRQRLRQHTKAAQEWLARADVVIRSNHRGQPGEFPAGIPDEAIRVSISPFGPTGPYADWRSADIVDQAIGGHLYLSGRPDREPLIGPTSQAALASGVFAVIGALAALYARRGTGRGQHVEVAHHEVMASLHQFTDVRYTHARNVLERMGNRYAGPGSPIGMYRASDGWIAFTVATAAHFETLLALTGLEHLLDHPEINSVIDLMVRGDIFDPALNQWLSEFSVADAVDFLQSARLAVGPVLKMRELLEDPQHVAREWWRPTNVGGHEVLLTGPAVHVGRSGWSPTAAALTSLDTVDAPPVRVADKPDPAGTANTDAPLTGVRVLDLTRVWAGPLAARILGDLGADVIMIESDLARGSQTMPQSYADASHFFPNDELGESWNRNGFVNKFALGKRSLCLDMGTPDGLNVFRKLASNSDVVIENFSPRVMPNWGLHDDALHELNPALIYLTMPGYGRTGPARDYSAYGPVLDSHAGLSTLMGYRDTDAWKCGIAWPDPMGGIHGALGTLIALWQRERDPQRVGTVVEVAQFETATAMIGDHIIRAQINNADPPILGNRHPEFAPQGVYRGVGVDNWIAMSIETDADWKRLLDESNLESRLPDRARGWTRAERRAHHEVVDDAISAWCRHHNITVLAGRLQAVGLAAAPVVTGETMMQDPQLNANEFYVSITHRVAGTHLWPNTPTRLSETPPRVAGPAPCLGEHNGEVLRSVAGCSSDEIEALQTNEIVRTQPRV
jgi:crotonobetainyl-CoA:carnitine CoA-transferase CaiB-like acyl-CoA transferase